MVLRKWELSVKDLTAGCRRLHESIVSNNSPVNHLEVLKDENLKIDPLWGYQPLGAAYNKRKSLNYAFTEVEGTVSTHPGLLIPRNAAQCAENKPLENNHCALNKDTIHCPTRILTKKGCSRWPTCLTGSSGSFFNMAAKRGPGKGGKKVASKEPLPPEEKAEVENFVTPNAKDVSCCASRVSFFQNEISHCHVWFRWSFFLPSEYYSLLLAKLEVWWIINYSMSGFWAQRRVASPDGDGGTVITLFFMFVLNNYITTVVIMNFVVGLRSILHLCHRPLWWCHTHP